MTLPPDARIVERLGGGDINEAYHVVLADGTEAFVKTRPDAAPGEYAAEAHGLHWLAEAAALRTPRVLALDESYLALEWIGSAAAGSLDRRGAEELGRGLARTHLTGAPVFGLESTAGPARFGSLQLSNEPTPTWPEFYARRRLLPLARLAREQRGLPAPALASVERVCGRLEDLCGPPETPSRLHGDLWSGNVLADPDRRPWLIDPSVYGGHREVDLAMLTLFGSPSPAVLDAYREAAPLAEGWPDRVLLYQLLPLLVHTVLFGGSYVQAAERAARHYAG